MGSTDRAESARLEFVDVSPVEYETADELDFTNLPSLALLDYAPGASIAAHVPLSPPAPTRQDPVWIRRNRPTRRAGEFYPSGHPRRNTGRTVNREWGEQLARAGMPTCRMCGTHNRRDTLHCQRCGSRLSGSRASTGTGQFPVQPTHSWKDTFSHLAVAAVVLGACGFLISLV